MAVLLAALAIAVAIPLAVWVAGVRRGRKYAPDQIGHGEASDAGGDGDD